MPFPVPLLSSIEFTNLLTAIAFYRMINLVCCLMKNGQGGENAITLMAELGHICRQALPQIPNLIATRKFSSQAFGPRPSPYDAECRL